ncbi:MAG: energy transducer TonB, partial [Alphaproteobacteria bacterium]|nr:energy transducer TonB [Alphaproteobacteria bacterium]
TSADTPADATIGEAATAAAPGAAADGRLAALRVPTRVGIAAQGNAPPDYPETARERGIEGRVLLRAMVDATGRARSVTVIGSSRHAMLDEAARRAVAGWRFTPATIDGVAVDGTVDVPIVFRLSD